MYNQTKNTVNMKKSTKYILKNTVWGVVDFFAAEYLNRMAKKYDSKLLKAISNCYKVSGVLDVVNATYGGACIAMMEEEGEEK